MGFKINKAFINCCFLISITFLLLFACTNKKANEPENGNTEWNRLVNLGDSLSEINRDSSIKCYNLALENYSETPEQKIDVLLKLSKSYWQPFDSSSLDYALKALRISDSLNSDNKKANAFRTIGKTYIYLNELDSALKYIDTAKIIASHLNVKTLKGICLNDESMIYANLDDYDKAILKAKEALNVYKDLKDTASISYSYARIGYVFLIKSDFSNALKYYYKAIDFIDHESSLEVKVWIYCSIADCFSRLEEHKSALLYFEKAKKIANNSDLRLSTLHVNSVFSNYLSSQGYYEKAINLLKESIKLSEMLQAKDALSYDYVNLGVTLEKTKNYDEALEIYDIALNIANENKNLYLKDIILSNISEIFLKKRQFVKAIELANKSLLSTNFEVQKQSNFYLSLSYDSLGNKEKALKHYKLYTQAKDSILNIEKSNQIKSLEAKYQTEQKQKQIELQQTQLENKDLQLKKQRTALYSAIAILGLFLVVISLVVNNVRKRKEQQQLLSLKNSELHQQNEEILAQRDEIESQKDIIEVKSKEVNDSITYARFIQQSILPSEKEVGHYFENFFILYSPKDLVSGDFFWAQQVGSVSYCAISDCTGHGVPGGFMSMLGIALLNEIHAMSPLLPPAERLTLLKGMLIKTLKQDSDESALKDGMDISFLSIDYQNLTLNYASALGKVVLVRDNTPTLLEYDRIPVGFSYSKSFEFRNHAVALQRGDLIYAFTDGIIDQLGGVDRKKYSTKRFTEKLSEISKLEFSQHKKTIVSEFNEWKGNLEQLDDILVFGIKV